MGRHLLLGVFLVVTACQDSQAARPVAPPAARSPSARPDFRWASVWVATPRGELPLKVEVAEDDRQRMHGLMFKEKLADDEGMIFLFDSVEVHVFWMKNTPLPLDMIFIDDQKRVVGVYENATPFSTDRMSVDKPSRYVLEVNAGWSRAHGVTAGTQLRFEKVER